MSTWRIDCSIASLTVEADTEAAARQEAIRQVTTATIRVWQGWTVIDLPSQSIAVKADTEGAAREEAVRQIANAVVKPMKNWRVETSDCFFVEAATEEEAYKSARTIMATKLIEDEYEICDVYEEEDDK
jgi:hypothetical protein